MSFALIATPSPIVGNIDLTKLPPEYREARLKASMAGRAAFLEWLKANPTPKDAIVRKERVSKHEREVMAMRLQQRREAQAAREKLQAKPEPKPQVITEQVRILALALSPRIANTSNKPRDARLPAPGTKLTRKHNGKTITVEVLEAGFRYDGQSYGSLSKLASEITGSSTNGFLWFGLNK